MLAGAVTASSGDTVAAIRSVLASGAQDSVAAAPAAPASLTLSPAATPPVSPGPVRVALDLSSLAPLIKALSMETVARAFSSHSQDGGTRAASGLTGDAAAAGSDAASAMVETEGGTPYDNPDRGMLLPDLEADQATRGGDVDRPEPMNRMTRPEDYGHLVEAANHTVDDVSVSTITGS